MTSLAAFVAIAVVVIVTPGPDTALTIRNTLLSGRRNGVLSALGVSVGQTIWTLATALGVSALLVHSQPLFRAVQVAGAAYLVWLGVQSLWSAATHEDAGAAEVHGKSGKPNAITALRQGLISNLTNPKMIAFFPALLPQFAPGGDWAFVALAALGFLFAAMTFTWLSGYAFAAAKAGDLLRRSRVKRMLDGVTGIALVGFGFRLALERR